MRLAVSVRHSSVGDPKVMQVPCALPRMAARKRLFTARREATEMVTVRTIMPRMDTDAHGSHARKA